MCSTSSAEVGGSCVTYAALLSAIVVPAFALLGCALAAAFYRRLAALDAQWRIDGRELVFCDPEEVLGGGSQGVVVRATYRGTPVAVKRFRLRGSGGGGSGGSWLLGENSGVIPKAADTAPLATAKPSCPNNHGKDSETEQGRPANGNGLYDLQGEGGVPVSARGGFDPRPALPDGAGPMDATVTQNRSLTSGRRPQTYQQLRRDMRVLVAIRHPCITAVLGVAEARVGGRRGLCLVMELVEFGSLWDLLHNRTFPLRADAALRILRDVAQGMRFLHGARPPMLHGDLKSGNVLVDRSFGGRISDFALSGSGGTVLSGTRLWMAPECLSGASGITAAAEAWSFGVIVHEVLTRRPPYAGREAEAPAEVAGGRLRLEAPAGCSREVATIMADCFQLDPALRALLARFALAAVGAAGETLVDEADPSCGPVRLRVGLHSGPCMACVVGRRSPKYTLLGDTVNTASRMESTSAPGRIQCSARTAEAIRAQDPAIRLERRGVVEVKGKGSMETFWVLPSDGADGGGGCDPDCRIDVLGTAVDPSWQ